MSKLQIIAAPQSNFVWVTRIVATEKRLDYELVTALPHAMLAIHSARFQPCATVRCFW
jgi:hypothetical protein